MTTMYRRRAICWRVCSKIDEDPIERVVFAVTYRKKKHIPFTWRNAESRVTAGRPDRLPSELDTIVVVCDRRDNDSLIGSVTLLRQFTSIVLFFCLRVSIIVVSVTTDDWKRPTVRIYSSADIFITETIAPAEVVSITNRYCKYRTHGKWRLCFSRTRWHDSDYECTS